MASNSTLTHADKRVLLSTLRRGSAESFSINVIGLGLMFLMHSILGRLVGPEQYGMFSHALSIATVLSIVAPLGWHTAVMRFVAQYNVQGKPGLVWGSILRGHQITFVSCCLMSVVLWFLGSLGSFAPKLSTSLVSAGLLLPPLTFFVLHHRIFRGLQRIKASMVPKSVIVPILVILSAFACAAATARDVITIYFITGLLSLLVSTVWLRHSLHRDGLIVPPEFQTRVWFVIALPMVFGGLSKEIISRTDIVMLGVMVNMDMVGVYSAAARIAMMNTFVLMAILAIASPLLSSAYHSGKIEEFRLILRKSMIWSAIGSFPLLIIMLLWPEVLLRCFGESFAGGTLLLRILAIGQFVGSATGPVGIALLMSDKERLFALTSGTLAILNVLANFVLILNVGALGAAIATSSCIALLNLWQLYLCKKKI